MTVYEMPDTEYRMTAEFKGLDGQSKPNEELLKGVFEQARFDTRFYEEVGKGESEGCVAGMLLSNPVGLKRVRFGRLSIIAAC